MLLFGAKYEYFSYFHSSCQLGLSLYCSFKKYLNPFAWSQAHARIRHALSSRYGRSQTSNDVMSHLSVKTSIWLMGRLLESFGFKLRQLYSFHRKQICIEKAENVNLRIWELVGLGIQNCNVQFWGVFFVKTNYIKL